MLMWVKRGHPIKEEKGPSLPLTFLPPRPQVKPQIGQQVIFADLFGESRVRF